MSSRWKDSPSLKDRTNLVDEDKRMNVLFSPFRKRDLNPVDYDSKLNYWTNAIHEWCENKRCVSFTVPTLQLEFSRKNRSPSCIQTVIDELVRTGEVMQLDNLMKLIPGQSWGSWMFNSFLISPAVWSFSKLKEALVVVDNLEPTVYVSVKYLKKLGDELVQKIVKESNSIMTKEDFYKVLNDDFSIADNTATVILHWLKLEKKALVHAMEDGRELLKVEDDVKPFSETEIVSTCLLQNQKQLEDAIQILEKEKSQHLAEVRAYLKSGARSSAKASLKKVKELERNIEKKSEALENLGLLHTRIKDVKYNAQILDAYKLGLNSLKAALNKSGLTEDNVYDTMSEIQEVNEMHDDILNALGQTTNSSSETELEDELASILATTPIKLEQDIAFPSIPTDSPEPMKNVSGYMGMNTPKKVCNLIEKQQGL